MKREEIMESVKKIVQQICTTETDIEENFLLMGSQINTEAIALGISSLQLVEIVVEVEDKFNVRLDEEDIVKFTQVKDLVSAIQIQVEQNEKKEVEIEKIYNELFVEGN